MGIAFQVVEPCGQLIPDMQLPVAFGIKSLVAQQQFPFRLDTQPPFSPMYFAQPWFPRSSCQKQIPSSKEELSDINVF